MTTKIASPSAGLGLLSPYQGILRNVIINGDMRIAQRGTSFADSANIFTLDRWYIERSGGVHLADIEQDTTGIFSAWGLRNSLKYTVDTADDSIADGDYQAIKYVVEGCDISPFIIGGLKATFSFLIKVVPHASSSLSFPATMCIGFMNKDNDRVLVRETTINAANTAQQISFTIDFGAESAADWEHTNDVGLQIRFMLMCGGDYDDATDNVWQTSADFVTSNQDDFQDYAGNVIYLAGVQLHPGSVALPFDPRFYAEELRLCQRYYVIFESGMNIPAYGHSTDGCYATFILPVTMRECTPTITLGAGTKYFWAHDGAHASTSTSPVNPDILGNYLSFRLPGFSGITDAYVGNLYVGGVFTVSAEL